MWVFADIEHISVYTGKAMWAKERAETIDLVCFTFSTFDLRVSWKAVTLEFSNEIDALSTIKAWTTQAFIHV